MSQADAGDSAHHRPYIRLAPLAAAATALLAVSWRLATRTDVSSLEERLFHVTNSAPGGLWYLLWPVMQSGTIGAPAVVAAITAVRTRRPRPPAAVLIGGYGAWAMAQVVKVAAGRARPQLLLAGVVLREGAAGQGFVSGHAAIASGIAAGLWPYLRWRGRTAAVATVVMVAAGRVYVGVHLPLDVIGGVAIGVLTGGVAHALLGVPRPR